MMSVIPVIPLFDDQIFNLDLLISHHLNLNFKHTKRNSMVLEACMIIVDNSGWSRNGDFHPTRWEAQEDSARILLQ